MKKKKKSSENDQFDWSFLVLLFCLITFVNFLDSDQDIQHVSPDLNPILFDTLIVFLKDFLILKKVSRQHNKGMKNYPACK